MLITFQSCRWGGTPMEDCIAGGHVQLVTMLRSKGATISDSLSATKLCDAASKGDIQVLKLLIDCAGLQVKYLFSFLARVKSL
jgi:ankyrin repeat protein